MTIKTNNEWEKEFERKFELQMNGCSECGGADLLFEGKNEYDLECIKSFISSERQKIKEEAQFELNKLQAETYRNEGRIEERQKLGKICSNCGRKTDMRDECFGS